MRISDWSSDVCSSDLRGLRYPSDHDRHRPDHCPLAALDIERRRDAAAADSGSYPVPSLRRPDARRCRRAGRPLWRECVVDRSPGAMPHGRVRWRDLLPRGSALWWTMAHRSEEHTSELQSLMRISYAVVCLKKKNIL